MIFEFGLGIGETRGAPPHPNKKREGAHGARKREAGGARVGPYALDVLGDPRVTVRRAERETRRDAGEKAARGGDRSLGRRPRTRNVS